MKNIINSNMFWHADKTTLDIPSGNKTDLNGMNQWTLVTTTTFVPKYVVINMYLLL